jgi:hypothetical protein
MYQLPIDRYHEAVVILQQVVALAHMGEATSRTTAMDASNRNSTYDMLGRFVSTIESLSVPVTKATVRDLRETLQSTLSLTFFSCGQLLVNLSETLRRELATVKVFSLDSNRITFYDSGSTLFGEQVQAKFPSIGYEIDQGGKCYACDLTTASAFHFIRAMEAGVRAMARCLGIPDPTKGSERNWAHICRAMSSEIERRWPASTGRMSGDAQVFDKLYGSIVGMQNPYRNETMHLEAKYTGTEALHIFELVKGLLQKVAVRMDEMGEPRA